MTARRIVLDTDIGSDVDDALCLALALASPELEVVALTTVGNEARLRARIAAKLLDLAGASGLPVHAGCRVPLAGGDGFNWFGHEGEGLVEPTEEPPIAAEHAVDALRRLLRSERDLEVVMVGPLTNLAAALVLEPELASRIGMLTLMGGHVRDARYGGKTFAPGVDYNLCSDPHASLVVLRAGIPTRLVTADVTLATWIDAADLSRIDAMATPFHRALAAQTRCWTPVQKRIFSSAGCDVDDENVAFLHDPLALACVHDESFCRFETLEIEPCIEGGVLRTIERAAPTRDSYPMRCATAVDAPRFRAHFMARVTGEVGAAGAQASRRRANA